MPPTEKDTSMPTLDPDRFAIESNDAGDYLLWTNAVDETLRIECNSREDAEALAHAINKHALMDFEPDNF